MPYRGGYNNYNFVIDSSFRPFSFQEMVAPYLMYKDAFEKSEEAYTDLKTKAGDFAYLSKTLPEGSQARQMYENYANELSAQAEDLASNGLTMNNRRALTRLKQRYQGEIGELAKAQERVKKIMDTRDELRSKGIQMYYANENPTIDQYLFGATPNDYSISAEDLNKAGMQLGQSISSRMYSAGEGDSVLGGLYKKWIEQKGVGQADISEFLMRDDVQDAIRDNLAERGLSNLSGDSRKRAELSFLTGVYNGIVGQQSVELKRDENVLSEAQKRDDARANRSLEFNEMLKGYKYENGTHVYDANIDPEERKNAWMYKYEDPNDLNSKKIGFSEEYIKYKEKEQEIKNSGRKNGNSSGGTGTPTKKNYRKDSFKIDSSGRVSSVKSGAEWGENASGNLTEDDIALINKELTEEEKANYKFYKDRNGSIYCIHTGGNSSAESQPASEDDVDNVLP